MTAVLPLTTRARIRQVQEQTNSVDPREIADKLLADLGECDFRAMLAEVLPEYVRQVMSAGRNSSLATTPPRSAKVAAVRDWHERLMAQPIDVSGGLGRWKALAACTRDELLAIAGHRRELAARNIATAEKYEALAAVVPDGGTAGQVPAGVVADVFGRAAE